MPFHVDTYRPQQRLPLGRYPANNCMADLGTMLLEHMVGSCMELEGNWAYATQQQAQNTLIYMYVNGVVSMAYSPRRRF